MGTLSNNKNKRNPQSQSSNGSNSKQIAKKPKSSSSSKPSRKTSVSRLHSYPDHITPITRQIHAPCAIISGFNSTQKRFTRNMLKKATPVEKSMFLDYFRAKERAIGSCRHVKFENFEQSEVVDNGNVGDSGNVVEVIDVDEEGSDGSGEVEEIRAKCKELNRLSDVSVVRRGPSLRKSRRKVKVENLEQCDDDVEVVEVGNGNVGVSGNVVEVIDVDEEGSSGSGEVEEIRAKFKKKNQLSDVSVERRGPSLRKSRCKVKVENLEQCDDDVEVIDVDEEDSNGSGEVVEIRAKDKKLNRLSDVSVKRRGPSLRKSRRNVKCENLEQCDDDVEVVEVGNGNVGVSGNVVEVIDVDEEGSNGSGKVVEIRAKDKKLNRLSDVSVERRGPNLRKLRCRVKVENLEQCDDDLEVIEVGNGNVGVSGNVVEVIGVDEEGSNGSGEVEEIRAKYTELNKLNDVMDVDVGSTLREKVDGSVERRGPSLRKLRHEVKLGELKLAVWLKLHPVKKEEVVVHDLFTPLSEEEEERVATAQSYSNREKVLVNHENSNIMITGKALQCLRPHAWLNDEVINIYLELLKDRERREPKKFLKCHFFNTFFYKKLVGGGRTRTAYDYESVKRWTAHKKLGYSLDECDKIFVPIHKEIHWCLAVINKKDKKFQYLDSLGGADKKVLRALAKYITDEVKDKTGKSINVTSWEQEFVRNLPIQENGYDCGMFMIKYIDFYSRDIGLCFSQDHMPYFRKRTAKEILMLRAN